MEAFVFPVKPNVTSQVGDGSGTCRDRQPNQPGDGTAQPPDLRKFSPGKRLLKTILASTNGHLDAFTCARLKKGQASAWKGR